MPKKSKVYLKREAELGERKLPHGLEDALGKLKKVTRDWESCDLHIRLGINPRKPEQNLRGTLVLPKGTGKVPRILVFAKGDKVEEARQAGADYVGLQDLIEQIKGGWLDFDIALAVPDCMAEVSKIAKVLGPRGLMPSPKSGTLSDAIGTLVKEFKAGKLEYRNDKTGIIHTTVGRMGFSAEDLAENVRHVMDVVVKAKPASLKGQFIKSVFIGSTQVPALRLDAAQFIR
ncbi:MAG: 50S ribosomal protein L1 [bacterium]|jgi:large subunit ribosomal protein L1